MRHKIKTDRLGRFSSLRKATIVTLARALLLNSSIRTTYAKAKAASPQVEHLVTLAKTNTLAARRQAYKVLSDHKLVSRLFGEIAELFKARGSGFTRIFKLGARRGDGAQMVIFELTEKPKKVKKEKTHPAKEPPPKPESKPHIPKEEKPKVVEKKAPTKKFLGGLRGFFKRERDSL